MNVLFKDRCDWVSDVKQQVVACERVLLKLGKKDLTTLAFCSFAPLKQDPVLIYMLTHWCLMKCNRSIVIPNALHESIVCE